MNKNGIQHIRSLSNHPSMNGLAERAIQTFKAGNKKTTEGSMETRLARFLFSYCRTPHTITGVSLSQLMFRRRVRNKRRNVLEAGGAQQVAVINYKLILVNNY